MTVTREIFDNDKEIVHINYSKKDIKKAIKRAKDIETAHLSALSDFETKYQIKNNDK